MSVKCLSMSGLVARDCCPACHSSDRVIRTYSTVFALAEPFPGGHLSFDEDVASERRLYECGECKLWYYSHVPSKETLQSLLDQPELPERWSMRDRRGFADARNVMSETFKTAGQVMDIGAHTGGFLDTVPTDWKKTAVDPMVSSSQLAAVRGMTVINSFVEDADLPSETFDCITAFDVYEHFDSPDAATAKISSALKPGGIAIVETGTTDALAAHMFRAGWWYLAPVEHYQAFSADSMSALFRRYGMDMIVNRRVFHDSSTWNNVLFQSVKTAGYTLLTTGNQPRVWRGLWKHLRPGATGTPPVTGLLEPDHMFLVFRKQ